MYDLQGGDFSNLPEKTTTKQAQQSAAPTHNHSNTIEAPTGTAVTQEVLSQLRQKMKQEFMTMIQDEVKAQVKAQIQKEMSAMQTEVANMSTKIEPLQEGIKENVGAAI
jgi:ADP-ribosylglycohydrolase